MSARMGKTVTGFLGIGKGRGFLGLGRKKRDEESGRLVVWSGSGGGFIPRGGMSYSGEPYSGYIYRGPGMARNSLHKYGSAVITSPAFLTSPQAFYGGDLGDPHDVAYGVGDVDYDDMDYENVLDEISDADGEPHPELAGMVVIGNVWR